MIKFILAYTSLKIVHQIPQILIMQDPCATGNMTDSDQSSSAAPSKNELTGYIHELEAQKENYLSLPQEETVSKRETTELAQKTVNSAEKVKKEGNSQPVEETNKILRAKYLNREEKMADEPSPYLDELSPYGCTNKT